MLPVVNFYYISLFCHCSWKQVIILKLFFPVLVLMCVLSNHVWNCLTKLCVNSIIFCWISLIFREQSKDVPLDCTKVVVDALMDMLFPNIKSLKTGIKTHALVEKVTNQIALIKRCSLMSVDFAKCLCDWISVLLDVIGKQSMI